MTEIASAARATRSRRQPRRSSVSAPQSHFARDADDGTPSRQRFRLIYQTLRNRIALLHYPPDTQIDVDSLAAEFEVSRTPIRSVLQRLEYQGLVITRHGVGTTVAPIDFQGLRDAVLFRMRLAEMFGDLSPLPASEDAVAAIREAREMCRGFGTQIDLGLFGRIDLRQHEAVCMAIGNPLLKQTYDELFFYTVRLWYFFMPRLDWKREVQIFESEVEALLRTMQRGDTRGVGFAVRNSLSAAVIRLDELFGSVEG
jgi:DNA-binding GntR family transcriptional regulator